jgi:hypothetical protein
VKVKRQQDWSLGEVGSLTTEKKWTGQQKKHARKMKLLKESEGLARSSVVGLAGTSSESSAVPVGEQHKVTVGILPSVIKGK